MKRVDILNWLIYRLVLLGFPHTLSLYLISYLNSSKCNTHFQNNIDPDPDQLASVEAN